METQYNIVISVKTPEGMQEIGNFFIGNNLDFALATFNSLNGYSDTDEKSILRAELVKKAGQMSVQYLADLSCTLDQYVENCRIIARDAFKFFTLEQ